MNDTKIKKLVISGFGIAIIFILTAFVAIPIAQFGYVNLGDAGVMLFASILNPALAFIVGGVGSASADLYLGFSQYAIFTFIIKGFEALIASYVFKTLKGKKSYFGFVLAVVIMVIGYYLTDAILYGDLVVALGGVGFNFIQGVVSLIIACLLQRLLYLNASKFFVE